MSPIQVAKDWWGDNIKRTAVLVTAVLTAIFTTMHFAGVAEPYWIVHRQFARDLVSATENSAKVRDDEQSRRLLSIEIAMKEGERRASQRSIDRGHAELLKLPTTSPDSIRDFFNDQVRRYSDQLRIIDLQLDELRRQQSGRRP